MKVAWICHFYNEEIQSVLHPSVKKAEMAAWIPQFVKLFEKIDTVELHVIAPDSYVVGYKHIKLRGINYHIFNPDIFIFGYNLLDKFKFNARIEYLFNKIIIRRIIKKIKPDIIHLFGAENAYYSSSIMQFKKRFPVLISVQGFISKTNMPLNPWLRKRIKIEKQILSGFKHIAYCAKSVANDILKFNPKAVLHFHDYPVPEIKPIKTDKKFDLVFFARVCKDKGFDDLLQALLILKQSIPDIQLCVIGESSHYYTQLAIKLGIGGNIYWAGRLPTLDDVHLLAIHAKISVLPSYYDTIPGTIIESMFMKLPVVAYSTGGIPEINDKEEYITLVNAGDIKTLAEKILWILQNPDVQKEKSESAYKRAIKMFDNSKIPDDILNAYNLVINDNNKK